MTKRTSRRRRSKKGFRLSSVQVGWTLGLLCVGTAALTLVGLFARGGGTLIQWWLDWLRRAVGWGVYVAPLGLLLVGVWGISLGIGRPLPILWPRILGLLVFWLSALALSHLFVEAPELAAADGRGGGYLGYWQSQGLSLGLGWLGAMVILLMLIGLALVLVFQVSLDEVIRDLLGLIYRFRDWVRDRCAFWRAGGRDPGQSSGAQGFSALYAPNASQGASGTHEGGGSIEPDVTTPKAPLILGWGAGRLPGADSRWSRAGYLPSLADASH